MQTIMDIHDILQCLPHRYPILLIDKIIDLKLNESIVAIKNVTINEPFFNGHFPEKPVMPGVIIIESMAQAGAVLAYRSSNTTYKDGVLHLFGGIDNARFRRIVEPGDQLRLEIKVLKAKKEVWKLEGAAYVKDELACSGEFISVRKIEQ